MNHREEFENLLGAPIESEKLDSYILFCLDNKVVDESKEYCERHHIIPRCLSSEHVKTKENIVLLTYPNHIRAHVLLTHAYPIDRFYRPLNYFNFVDKDIRYAETKSEQVTQWWIYFKTTPAFEEWKNKRKDSTDNFKAFREAGISASIRRGELFKKDPLLREEFCKTMRELWTEDMRNEVSERMRNRDSKILKSISESMKRRYLNEEFMEQFTETMTRVNKDPAKREDASKKIKALYEDPEFKERVMLGRKNGKKKDPAQISKASKEVWARPGYKEKMAAIRRESYLKRKLKRQGLSDETN